MKFVKIPALLVVPLVAQISLSQTSKPGKQLPASAYKLIAIQVSGTTRYKPDEVIRASGLTLGQTVHKDDLERVVGRLGQTDAFTDISYSFEYSAEGTKLKLQVKDAARFAPVRFENLVWFSDQELMQKLQAQVPLFNGELPVKGPLPDDLTEALQAMVNEKKIAAQVSYSRVATDDGPTEAFKYSVTGPRISIQDVSFSGASSAELPALEAAGKELRGVEYDRSAFRGEEEKSFLPVFLAHGHLKAKFGEPEAKVVQSDQDEVLVDVIFPVEPGPQYKLSAIEVAGYKTVPLENLRQAIQVKIGQPADAMEIGKDAEIIKSLYATKGYMDAEVRTEPELDNVQHSVRYRYVINEGDIFKMGELEILGVDSHTKDRLKNNWTLLTGDTYNGGYTRRFVAQALKEVLTTGEWNSDIQETLDRKDKTVDVTLHFIARY